MGQQLAERPRAWHGQKIFQEQRGFSLDDLDRFGMPVPAETRTGALWRSVPVDDLSRVLAGQPPAAERSDKTSTGKAATGKASTGKATTGPRAVSPPHRDRHRERIWPALRPVGPGPEDRRMQAEIRDLSRGASQEDMPLRGCFADFRLALRSHLTGLDGGDAPLAGSSDPVRSDAADLAGIVGAAAARSHAQGDLPAAVLPYLARHDEGVGAYRFSESQLEDLGYYQRLPRPRAANDRGCLPASGRDAGHGAVLAWHGRFTGRRGIASIADLMNPQAQERLLLEAFVRHLRDLAAGLPRGRMLADWLGRPIGVDPAAAPAGGDAGDRLTVSALLAAAQIHGTAAVAQILLAPDSLTRNRALVRTLRGFAGYATPFDGVPRPSDTDLDAIMARVRGASTEGQAEPRRQTMQQRQYLNQTIKF